MPKIQGYESHAIEYDQWFTDNPEIRNAEIKAIKSLLPIGQGIEIGAGSGQFTLPLQIDTGIEPSPAMRNLAKAKGIDLIDGVAESLPIENGHFDFAIFITSTCFLDDPLKAYQEAARVTKDNGKILIAFLEKNSELGRAYEKHKANSPFYCDATFYSYTDIESFLKQAGYKNFKSVQTVLPENESQQTNDVLPGHGQGAFVVINAEK